MSDWNAIETELSWRSPALFTAIVPRAQLLARFGAPRGGDADVNGDISVKAWLIRFACGLEACIRSFDASCRDTIEVRASQRDRDHLLFHLGIQPESIDEPEPRATTTGPLAHQVLRLDDNGNQFEVTRASSACQATAIAQAYEARGHKQTYWVRQIDAS